MKTIKQLADELGVSKEAIRKQVPRLPPTTVTTSANRTTLIDSTGEAVLRTFVLPKVPTKVTTTAPTETPQNDKLYDILQSELEAKNKQLEVKDKQIEELNARLAEVTELANISQRLHAGTIQQQLASPSDEQPTTDEIEAETPDATKPLAEPNKKFNFDEIITISGEKDSDFQKNTPKKEKRGFFGLFSRKP